LLGLKSGNRRKIHRKAAVFSLNTPSGGVNELNVRDLGEFLAKSHAFSSDLARVVARDGSR
jgi:hypothetical protein